MKKTSTQEISEIIEVKGGIDLEQAAAIALVSSLLSGKSSQQQVTESNWTSRSGLREGLDKNLRGKLR